MRHAGERRTLMQWYGLGFSAKSVMATIDKHCAQKRSPNPIGYTRLARRVMRGCPMDLHAASGSPINFSGVCIFSLCACAQFYTMHKRVTPTCVLRGTTQPRVTPQICLDWRNCYSPIRFE